MSAVSSIGGSGQGLYQFIQNLSAGGSLNVAPSSATASSSASTAASGTQSTTGGHHHHHGGGGGMFQQIESAVSSALQSAQSNGSSDPNQIIQDAIAKVLKNQQSQGTQGANGTSAAANGAQPTGSDSDGDNDGSGQAGATGNSANQAFFQSLQALGVSPQQFRADFLAAIQSAQNGQVDVGAAMKSFPPGSNVDTLA